MRHLFCWLLTGLFLSAPGAFAADATNKSSTADPRSRRSGSRTRDASTTNSTATAKSDDDEANKEPDPNSREEEERRQAAALRLQSRLIRGPYLQLGTPNSIVVRWRTEKPSGSLVRFGLSETNLKYNARANGAVSEHVVLLTNLLPSTRYFYALSTNALAGTNALSGTNAIVGTHTNVVFTIRTNSFVTAPPYGTPKPTRVWVLGDPGTRRLAQKQVRDSFYAFKGRSHVDCWLMLGDNAYTAGKDDEYQAGIFVPYSEMLARSVLWPALGNHDGGTANSVTQSGIYYDIFTLPTQGQAGGVMSGTEAYYSYNWANIHFICLDSHDSDRSTNGLMYKWLQADLTANRQTWTVAYWHHPPYSKASHDSDNDKDSDARSRDMRAVFNPLLEAGGCDLVLCGHSHAYERSWLMDGHYGYSSNFNYSFVKDRGDGRLDGDGPYRKPNGPAPHQGTVYVVAGSSGQTSGVKGIHPAMQQALNVAGSLVLDFNGPRLDVTFLDNYGMTRDYFTMLKGSQPGALARLSPRFRTKPNFSATYPGWNVLTNLQPADLDGLLAQYRKATNAVLKTRLTYALAAVGDAQVAAEFARLLTNKIMDRTLTAEEEDLRFATVRALGLLATRYDPPMDILKKGISADWWYFRTNWISERPQAITASTLQACTLEALGLSGRPEVRDTLEKARKKYMQFKDGEPLEVVRTYTNELTQATNRVLQFPRFGPLAWRRHLLAEEFPNLPSPLTPLTAAQAGNTPPAITSQP